MNKGFYISKLLVSGNDLEPAEIILIKGLNVISGITDTGKSYILSCINYILGGSVVPESNDHSRGYINFYLEINTYEEKAYTLLRKLNEKIIYLWDGVNEDFNPKKVQKLSAKHGSPNSISQFLLQLSGFDYASIKKNQFNKIRSLSFRDLVEFILVDEQRIIQKISPVYSGQVISKTEERSIFKLLLTGKDDSNLLEVEEPKIHQSKVNGKIEFINQLIDEISNKVEDLASKKIINPNYLRNQINEISELLELTNNKLESLTKRRNEIWLTIQEIESKLLHKNELTARFLLLKDHYLSDLNRLDFLSEGEFYLSQLNTVFCPICGGELAKSNYHCLNHNDNSTDFIDENTRKSIRVEFQKIQSKIHDLESTISVMELEIKETKNQLEIYKNDYQSIIEEINNNIEPVKSDLGNKLSILFEEQEKLSEINLLKKQLTQYYNQKLELEKSLEVTTSISTVNEDLNYLDYKNFCLRVEKLLKAWNYPNLRTVEFDTNPEVFDLVLSGSGRQTKGKGYRAITYSAFVIGLLNYCIEKELPHPHTIIIDSPLTTYHGREPQSIDDEEVDISIQNAFFRNLSTIDKDRQIIIIDNKIPEIDIQGKIQFIYFGGLESKNRKGFFPIT